jgi:hypothetical protein
VKREKTVYLGPIEIRRQTASFPSAGFQVCEPARAVKRPDEQPVRSGTKLIRCVKLSRVEWFECGTALLDTNAMGRLSHGLSKKNLSDVFLR